MKHLIFKILSVISIIIVPFSVSCTPQWSWLYSFNLKNKETCIFANNSLLIEKKNIPQFSQLIVGFIGKRPRGSFTFLVQAHDPVTKKWGKWHKMMEWGGQGQRSYMSSSDGHTQGAHVRLEVEKYKKADGFKVKIQSSDKTMFKLLKHVYVTTAYDRKFNSELVNTQCFKRLPSVKISNIPRISQFNLEHEDNYRICSPTSCVMVATFLQRRTVDPLIFAKNVYDEGLNTYGNWPFNTAHLYEQIQRPVFPTRLNSFTDLHKQLLKGLPVIVSVRGALEGAPKPYPNGHLFVVIGWDNKKAEVICHDPAFTATKDIEHRYALEDFIQAWELSKRLTYWISDRIT